MCFLLDSSGLLEGNLKLFKKLSEIKQDLKLRLKKKEKPAEYPCKSSENMAIQSAPSSGKN